MMYVGIDVGGLTGWAILNDDGVVLFWGDLAPNEIEGSLLQHLGNAPDADVCIEYPVVSYMLDRQSKKAMKIIERMFPNATVVQPGTWKTSMVHVILESLPDTHDGIKVSKHMKEAVGIARWRRAKVQGQMKNG